MSNLEVTLYTDGACQPNPGPGGWAAILKARGKEKQLSGGFRRTTNNRMELLAVIAGLAALKRPGIRVKVVSDSQYVTSAISRGWLEGWAARQFKKSDGFRENTDLWIQLRTLIAQHRISTEWIRGHAGHPENEHCDRLAVAARSRNDLPTDEGFENPASTLTNLGLTFR